MTNIEEVILVVTKGATDIEARYQWNGRHYTTSNCFKGRITRCRECRHYENPDKNIYENCVRDGKIIPMQPDDFCSYGEPREDE